MAGYVGAQVKRSQVHPVENDSLADENGASMKSVSSRKPKERQPLQSAENRLQEVLPTEPLLAVKQVEVSCPGKKPETIKAERMQKSDQDAQSAERRSAGSANNSTETSSVISLADSSMGSEALAASKNESKGKKRAKEPWRDPNNKDATEIVYSRGGLKAASHGSQEDKSGVEKKRICNDATDLVSVRRTSVSTRKFEPAKKASMEEAASCSEVQGKPLEDAGQERDAILKDQSQQKQEEKGKASDLQRNTPPGSEKQLEGQDEEGWMKVKKKSKRRTELPPWNSCPEINSLLATSRRWIKRNSADLEARQATEERKPANQGPKVPTVPGAMGSSEGSGDSPSVPKGVARQDAKAGEQGRQPVVVARPVSEAEAEATSNFVLDGRESLMRVEPEGVPKAELTSSTNLVNGVKKGAVQASSQTGSAQRSTDKSYRPDPSGATPANVSPSTKTKGDGQPSKIVEGDSSQKHLARAGTRRPVTGQVKEALKGPESSPRESAPSAVTPKEGVSKKAEGQSMPKPAPATSKSSSSNSKLSVSAAPFIPRSLQTSADSVKPAAKLVGQNVSVDPKIPSQPLQGSSIGSERTLKKEKEVEVSASTPQAAPPRVAVTPVRKRKPAEKPLGRTAVPAVNSSGTLSQPAQSGSSTAGHPSTSSNVPPKESGKRASLSNMDKGTSSQKDLVVGTIRVPHLETVPAGVMPGKVSLVVKSGQPRASASSRDAAGLSASGKRHSASSKQLESAEHGAKANERRVAHQTSAADSVKSDGSALSKSGRHENAIKGKRTSMDGIKTLAAEGPKAAAGAPAVFGLPEAAPENAAPAVPKNADKREEAIEVLPVDLASSPELLATESGRSGRKSKPKRLSLVARQQAPRKDKQPKDKEPKPAGKTGDGKKESGEAAGEDTLKSRIEERSESVAVDVALSLATDDSPSKAASQSGSNGERRSEQAAQNTENRSEKESTDAGGSGSVEQSGGDEKGGPERKGSKVKEGRKEEIVEKDPERKVTASSDKSNEHGEDGQTEGVENAPDSQNKEEALIEKRDGKACGPEIVKEGASSLHADQSVFRQRLWSYLFENLGRSIDELYFLCELECDEPHIAETVTVLREAVEDFRELKDRVDKQDRFERERKAGDLPVVHRRNRAIAWEVQRTTSTTERAELLAASLDALRFLRTSSVSQPATRKPALPRIPPSKTRSNSRAGSQRWEALALEPGRSSSAPSKFSRGKASRVVSEAPKKERDLTSSTEDGSIIAPGVHMLSEEAAAGRQRGEEISKEGVAEKRAFSKRHSASKREPLVEETSNKSAESDRMSDPGSDRASVHSLSRFSDVGSDPADVSSRYGLAASLSRVAAWREKRNWMDHLANVPSPKRLELKRNSGEKSLPRGSLAPDKRAGSADRAKMLHDRLMSPERRKKTPSETREKVDEKQARAAQVRIDLESERRAKMQRSAERASKVTEWQEIRRSKLSKSMEVRHQQSESRYEAHLAQIVKRAGDEATKVNEIQFINTMTAENKKLSTQQKMQDSEARRQELLKLQSKKREEEAAKEEAAQERRKQKEEERQRKLSEAQRKKEEAAARQEEEKRKLMQERKERALQQAQRLEEQKRAQQEQTELLGQRLAERLKESSARRQLYLEQIKERAAVDPERLRLGSDSPYGRLSPNRLSPSRHSPMRRPNSREGFRSNGRSSEREKQAETAKANDSEDSKSVETGEKPAVIEAPLEVPTSQDTPARPLERPTIVIPSDRAGSAPATAVGSSVARDALKKRVKRVRQRLVQKKHEWVETEKETGSAQGKSRAAKWLLDMQRQQAKGGNGVALESAAGELVKFFEGRPEELNAARRAGLIDFAASALVSTTPVPPPRAVAALLRVLKVLLTCPGNRSYFIARNFLPPLLPILTASLSRFSGAGPPGESNPSRASTPGQERHVAIEKEGLDAAILEGALSVAALVVKHKCDADEKVLAMQEDLVELIVVSEVPDKLRDLLSIFDCPPSEGQLGPIPGVYVAGLLLLEGLTSARGKLAGASELPVHEAKVDLANNRAAKAVLDAVVETGLVGLPSLLTAVLLRAAPPKTTPEQAAAVLPTNFEDIATLVLRVLNNLARLDLKLFQAQLEFSDLKVEFFHLVTFLLSHCTCKWKQASDKVAGLLHETLLLVGYFALLHSGNQAVLRWGKSPTILQKLCELPFPYFSDATLQPLLFGTLLSACYGSDRNRDVVERELSADMLLGFLQTSAAEVPKEVLEAAVSGKPDEVKEEAGEGKVQKLAQTEKGQSLSGEREWVEDDCLFVKGTEGQMQVTAITGKIVSNIDDVKSENVSRDHAVQDRTACEADKQPSSAVTKGEPGHEANDALREKAASEPGTRTVRSKHRRSGVDQTKEDIICEINGAEKPGDRLTEAKRDSASRPTSADAKTAGKMRGEKKQDSKGGNIVNATEAKKPGQEVAAPFRLQNRFPLSLWTAAEEYFAKPPAQH